MKRRHSLIRSHGGSQGGQALVEFAIAITVFLVVIMGIVDFGRAIYQYNGVSQAAREIARTTSAHPGTDFTTTSGQSPETLAVIQTQKGLVPDLGSPVFSCVDIAGNPVSTGCVPGDFVRVAIMAPYTPVVPRLLGLSGIWNLSSTTTVELQ